MSTVGRKREITRRRRRLFAHLDERRHPFSVIINLWCFVSLTCVSKYINLLLFCSFPSAQKGSLRLTLDYTKKVCGRGRKNHFLIYWRRADFPLTFLWSTDQSSQSFPFSSSSLLPAAAACTAGAFPPTLLLLSAFNSAFPCLPLPLRPPNSESTALQYCTFVTPASKRSN